MIKVLVPYKEIDNAIQNTLNLNLIDIIDKITTKEEDSLNFFPKKMLVYINILKFVIY